MKPFLINLLLWSQVHHPQAAVATLNAEADGDRSRVRECLAGIFRFRARQDVVWMQDSLLSTPDEILGLEPHLGTIESGATRFPPPDMSWAAYAACLAIADAAFWDWPEAPPEKPDVPPPAAKPSPQRVEPMPPAKRPKPKLQPTGGLFA